MAKLPLDNAAAFVANFGLSVAEVARHCGVSVAVARRAVREQEARHREDEKLREQRRQKRALAARARERTKGELHDLNVLLGRVQRAYFAGQAEGVRIRWGRGKGNGRCVNLGTYDRSEQRITIQPVLERAPRYVVECVIYHELLHHVLGPRHSPAFRQKEREFRQWEQASRWLAAV